jgi:hypothetical protein
VICDISAEILPFLGKDPDDPTAGLITVLHAHAEQLVKDFVGSKVEQATYSEILPPWSPGATPNDLAAESPALFLPAPGALQLGNTPVRSVTSVHETGVPGGGGWPDTTLVNPADYWLDAAEEGLSRSGLLYRTWGGWLTVPRNIRVVYVGGWTPDELEGESQAIKLAVKQTAVKLFREAEAYFDNASGGAGVGPLASEAIMGWSQGYDAESLRELAGMQNDLPTSAKMLLQPFINMGRKLGRLR